MGAEFEVGAIPAYVPLFAPRGQYVIDDRGRRRYDYVLMGLGFGRLVNSLGCTGWLGIN